MSEVNKAQGTVNIGIAISGSATPVENKYNLVRVSKAEQMSQESGWASLPHRIETAGYMSSSDTYLNTTQQFVDLLINELGSTGKVGLVTSPTPFNGSIDYITTIAAHKAKLPLKYVTCEGYVQYIKPEEFNSSGIDITRYIAETKYVLPTGEEYLKATSKVANTFLVTGGRLDTITGFVNAINNGNKVIILNNKLLDAPAWDSSKNRPNNSASYLAQMLSGNETYLLIPEKGFSKEFLEQNKEAIASLVKVITINSEADIQEAAKEAVRFLKA